MSLPPKIYAYKDRLYSLKDVVPGVSVHPLVRETKHMIARKMIAEEGAVTLAIL